MPALIDSMAFFGSVPWHGLGERMDDACLYDAKAAMIAAKMDWEVDLHPLYVPGKPVDGKPTYVEVPERYMYRKDTDKLLGCVGPQYTPFQNVTSFDWFQPFLDSKLAAMHTCGSLQGGRKTWVLAQIQGDPLEIVKNDTVERFVMLSNSHDGTRAVSVGLTPIRIVCANTLSLALNSKASQLIRVRHSSSVKQNVDNLRDIIDLANNEFVATAEQYRLLASRGINQADLMKYVKISLDVKPEIPDVDLPTRTVNTLKGVIEQFEKEAKLAGTNYWTAYNAVNHYRVWEYGRSPDNRLNSLWFGPNMSKDKKSLELALTLSA